MPDPSDTVGVPEVGPESLVESALRLLFSVSIASSND